MSTFQGVLNSCCFKLTGFVQTLSHTISSFMG
jgi:hypothetical protein